jgi:hypothetical protein
LGAAYLTTPGDIGVTEAGELDQLIEEVAVLKQKTLELVSHLSQDDKQIRDWSDIGDGVGDSGQNADRVA